MTNKSYLLKCFALLYLIQISTEDTIADDFKKYVIESLNYIREQTGWKSLKNIQFKQGDYTSNIDNFTSELIDENNYLIKLNYMTHLVNCKYTKKIQKFNYFLSLILDKCETFLNRKKDFEFEFCVNHVFEIINNSKMMFLKLLDVTKYIDKIDLRIINPLTLSLKPINIEVEYLFKADVMKIKKKSKRDCQKTLPKSKVLYTFQKIRDFSTDILQMVLILYKNREVCGPFNENLINMESSNENGIQELIKSFNDLKNYDQDILVYFNSYYKQVVDSCYLQLGFEQLIGTNNFKYNHCSSNIYYLKDGVRIYNFLLSHSGWKSWKHLSVINYFTKKVLIDNEPIHYTDIIGQVNKANYSVIRTSTVQVLRCRYLEIIEHFKNMLDTVVKISENEDKIDCAINIYETIFKSDGMFKNFLFALCTLRHTARDKINRIDSTSLEKLIELYRNFIYDVKRKYNSTNVFVYNKLNEATLFINDIKCAHITNLSNAFITAERYIRTTCKINKELSDMGHLMDRFMELNKSSNLIKNGNIHKSMCKFLNFFIEKMTKENYDNLGFNNINKIIL
ncbi:DNA-directed RNA polymerase subunit beta''-like [Daktulosphaira vitifoliae]|uniref:DNA-directed RNA polymerase subunit beta''-like n=1 Tax=Daktulosphaira vitifoliae TaxID=58002 RepID=UPI0021AAB7B4|nr:DNA-directed RNA polymerase subunit beta''-like [Daktulosphaira vitifoliae]